MQFLGGPFELPEEMRVAMQVAQRKEAQSPDFGTNPPNEEHHVSFDYREWVALRAVLEIARAYVDGDEPHASAMRFVRNARLLREGKMDEWWDAMRQRAVEALEGADKANDPRLFSRSLMNEVRVSYAFAEALVMAKQAHADVVEPEEDDDGE